MTTPTPTHADTQAFISSYGKDLLDRDAHAIAERYAVPGLILFPGQAIAVTSVEQTEQFFASAFDQYDGVTSLDHDLVIMDAAPGTVWADVTWSFDGVPHERMCYQLVAGSDGLRIAVLTPMELAALAGGGDGDAQGVGQR